tara:strand:- start:155 stop:337 length:183 start_codon:yes stop_codon:yes gene_type:complete
VDVLLEHHKQLIEESVKFAYKGNHEQSDAIDDKIIVIENYLEVNHLVKWDGLKFVEQEKA